MFDRILYGLGCFGGMFMLYVLIELDTNIVHKIIGIPIMFLFAAGCYIISTSKEKKDNVKTK